VDGVGRRQPAGPVLFARFAYPPNERGSCGPPEHRTLYEYAAAGASDPDLGRLARRFAGAWPYLELIAGVSGIPDPLDHRVVEAYWIGNDLLDRIDMTTFGNALMDRFRRQTGPAWAHLAEAVPAGAVPHHSFHVLDVYPWVGLLGHGRGEPLEVLQQCRIRWGQVVTVDGDDVVVMSRPLTYCDGRLGLGAPRAEHATGGLDGVRLAGPLSPGDWVGLHWSWVCDRLGPRQLHDLQRFTRRHLRITNAHLEHSGPAAVLG
jgi:hypothetical protein